MSVSTMSSGDRPESAAAEASADRSLSREARRLPTFDGLRGICAIMLLVVHMSWISRLAGSYDDPPTNLPAAIVIGGFQIAVGVFFLLSGLFLYRPFARAIIAGTPKPELGPFFLRRVLRLAPAYYLVVLAALLLLNFNSIDSVWYVLRPVLMVQNYDNVWYAGLDITWSVPSELQWYLALPVFAWLTQFWARKGTTAVSRARRLLIIVPILVVVGFGWIAYVHQPSMGIFPKEFWWPIGVAANIGVGMGLGILSALKQVSPADEPKLFRVAAKHPNLFWLGALVVFALNCWEPFGRAGYGDFDDATAALVFYTLFILYCGFLVIPMAAGGESRLIQAIAGNRVIVFLGRISYGIYLWHFIVQNLYMQNGSIFGGDPKIAPALRGTIGFWELEIAVLVGTVLVATASYYLVERPILNWGERLLRERAERRAAGKASAQPAAVPASV